MTHYISKSTGIKTILIFLVSIALLQSSQAQITYPQNYFINPLDLSITLAGTFGEVRSNHFHTGLDIRTDSREGLAVHAAADGYISRINVSPYGYGNALYITHPNGFVTVYGHLSRYNDAIAKYVKKKQYEMHRYSMDLYLKAGDMPVKKGDTVAFSGSTGAAEGPHLHFEIRDEKSEDPLNPLLFGYRYADRIPPIIVGICIYPLNDSSNVNGKHTPLYLKVVKKEGHYALATDSAIKAYGKIGVGVRTYDMADGVESHNGPYSQVLTDDKDTIYYSQMGELSFSSIHYVNGHIDYEAFRRRTETLEHSFLQDNDRLDIYKKIKNRGRISFIGGTAHHMQYAIADFAGNTSILPFDVQAEAHMGSVFHDTVKYSGTIYWKKSFDFAYKDMLIHIPADITFQNVHFYCSDETTDMHTLCPIYHVQNTYTPLNSSYTLKLKPSAKLPDSLVRRAVMVQVDGKHVNSLGGVWDSGYMTAHPKTFGDFSLMLDLSRPTIKPVNIYKDKDMSKSSAIEFQISDNLSGIASYNAYVDDKWILMEFNPKKDMVYYTFDEHVTQGKHKLKVVVTDNVGNTNVYNVDFTR